jgi:hypothetical protein
MIEIIEIVPALIFDSWNDALPELRTADNAERHLIYEEAGVILDLVLKNAEKGACLHIGGQVLPADGPLSAVSDLKVSLKHGGRQTHTFTNALGEFSFHAIPNGIFDLVIRFKNRQFNVLGLSLGEPRMWRVVPSLVGAE